MHIIEGTRLAGEILKSITQNISTLPKQPVLNIIVAGDDQASIRYVDLKRKKSAEVGIDCRIHRFTQNSADEIIESIKALNLEAKTHPNYGIMVQLPLFPEINAHKQPILNAIDPKLDVDGLTALNQGWISQNIPGYILPATVKAIIKALEVPAAGNLDKWLVGKHIVIVNHSDLIGKPLSAYLMNRHATVTVAHAFSVNLASLTIQADVLITATGQVGLITHEMVKPKAVVIDVSSVTTRDGVRGDVLVSPELLAKVDFLSPVPGGIGPLTIACLFENLYELSSTGI